MSVQKKHFAKSHKLRSLAKYLNMIQKKLTIRGRLYVINGAYR